jgi:hypothetical protein
MLADQFSVRQTLAYEGDERPSGELSQQILQIDSSAWCSRSCQMNSQLRRTRIFSLLWDTPGGAAIPEERAPADSRYVVLSMMRS